MKCQWCKKGTYRIVFKVERDNHGVPVNLYLLARQGINIQGSNIPELWASSCCGHVVQIRPDLVVGPKAA